MLHAMIMAGGGGTRFWPRSRNARPKQFLAFAGERSLLQSTLDRIAPVVPPERTWVITGKDYVAETVAQLPDLPPGHIVGEPFRRDTAPCVGLGAALIAAEDADATIAVLPADHIIEPEREFQRALHAAEQFAEEFPDCLFTFGVPPTFASTGYGYIHRGAAVGERSGVPLFAVREFKEKPSAEVAEQFVASGEYDWNSGIFVWKAKTILGQLERRKPELHAAVQRIAAAWGTPQQAPVFRSEYEKAEKISIDFAVMQKAAEEGKVLVLAAPYKWDDVGSWLALERGNPQDADRNTVHANHCGIKTENCVIVGEADRVIGTYGVSGLLIVQDGNAILVADRKFEDKVKEIVDKLKATGRGEYT